MSERAAIIGFLDDLLSARGWPDLGPNGLQVPGRERIDRVVTAVSAHQESIDRAVEAGAGLMLVHHGLLWDFHPRALTTSTARRLKSLLLHDVNLAQYHLPLDAHPVHGNNALLAEALGCAMHEAFGEYKGRLIGRLGTFADGGIAAEELFARVETVCEREPLVFPYGPAAVERLGIISGGATASIHEAIAAGCDAFITGEVSEHCMADAREGAIHYISAGHYATETFGIRRLGELVANEFGVDHIFIDVPNPV